MQRKALGWTVVAIVVAIVAVLLPDLPDWVRIGLLVLVAPSLLAYGLWLIVTKTKPTSVDVQGEICAVGQWKNDKWTGVQVEMTVALNWDQSLQLRFMLELPSGIVMDGEAYHRDYVAAKADLGFVDNPKVFDPGETGPFKIAFVVPASLQIGSIKGSWLSYESVLPNLAEGRIPLVQRPQETTL